MSKQIFDIKRTILLFTILLPVISIAQVVNIQSNNPEITNLKKQFVNTELKEIIERFEKVISNYDAYNKNDLKIDIIYFDSLNTGSLDYTNPRIDSELIINKWKTKYIGEERVLFFYIKERNIYTLKSFVLSEGLNYGQIPDIVGKYIRNEIVLKQNTEKDQLYFGLNALKNAFDQQFKKKLEDMGPKMLSFKYYYKGYSYIPQYYCYFKYEETERNESLNKELQYKLGSGLNMSYNDIYLKNWDSQKANVFNADIDQELIYFLNGSEQEISDIENIYVKTNEQGSQIFSEYNNHITKNDLFDFSNCTHSTIDNIPKTISTNKLRKISTELANSDSIIKLEWNEGKKKYRKIKENIPVNSSSLYKVYNGPVYGVNRNNLFNQQEVSKITSEIGWSLWPNASYNQATWCNVYASDLSRYIYGEVDGDSPIPYGTQGYSANDLNDKLNSNKSAFIKLNHLEPHNDPANIWKYINKGFPIYFSKKGDIIPNTNKRKSGHIETGISIQTALKNKIYYESTGEDNNKIDFSSKKITIGAGTYTGFKTYLKFKFLLNAEVFLYLGYLKKDYQHE